MANLMLVRLDQLCFYDEAGRAAYNASRGVPGQVGPELNQAEWDYMRTYCQWGSREGQTLPGWAAGGIAEQAGPAPSGADLTIMPASIPMVDGLLSVAGLSLPGVMPAQPVSSGYVTTKEAPAQVAPDLIQAPGPSPPTPTATAPLPGTGKFSPVDELDELEAKILDAGAYPGQSLPDHLAAASQPGIPKMKESTWWMWGLGGIIVATGAAVAYLLVRGGRKKTKKRRKKRGG